MSYYDGDPWSNHVSNFIECAECESEFDQQEEEGGNICPTCIDKEEGEQVETYLITMELTVPTNPTEWNWDNFLNLDGNESYKIHSIGQITRNKEEGESE
jgi:hypothetical protein